MSSPIILPISGSFSPSPIHYIPFRSSEPVQPQPVQPTRAVQSSSPVQSSSATPPSGVLTVTDTVDLSIEAQTLLLQGRGDSLAQIADGLGLSLTALDSYLGITPTPTAVNPVPSTPIAA